MPVFSLCQKEPILDIIRDVFNANPLRVPEERMQPLCLIGASEGKTHFLGGLDDAIVSEAPNLNLLLKTSRMADVSGKQSSKVNFDTGMNLLEGFLKGFGISTSGIAEIKVAFQGAQQVSFSFGDVNRRYIEAVELGKVLTDVKINTANPGIKPYVDSDYNKLLLIDSVIVSKNFSVKVEKSGSQEFKVGVPAINKALGKLDVGVKAESLSSLDVTFKGEKALAFAFSCLEIRVSRSGKVTGLEADVTRRSFGIGDASLAVPEAQRTLLTNPGELLEFDSAPYP